MNPSARRLYLSVALKLLILAGLVALASALLASLGAGKGETAVAADPWRPELDWSQLAPGEVRTLHWPDGREIWVYRRLAGAAVQLEKRNPAQLHDPASRHSRQPPGLETPWRSRHPELFVFLPYETARGCRVRQTAGRDAFVEPCHGARFDSAGRLLKAGAVAQQQNLTVPDYELIGEQRLRLLPPGSR